MRYGLIQTSMGKQTNSASVPVQMAMPLGH